MILRALDQHQLDQGTLLLHIPRPGALWIALGLLGLVDAVWLLLSPLRLAPESVRLIVGLIPCAIVGGWASFRLAHRPKLQMLCSGGVFIVIAWPALRVFNHLTMSIAYPLADDILAQADAMLGFRWIDYALWLDQRPLLIKLMGYCYAGLTNYSLLLFILLLCGRNSLHRCRELMVLFFVTALVCSLIGMLLPAKAAMAHFQPPRSLFHNIDPWIGAYHLDHLVALRTDPKHALDLNRLPGLVTFPSFHTAMGIIAIYCARGTPWLLGPSVGLNLLMIASTPLFGSHYLIDIIGGVGIAVGVILVRRMHDHASLPVSLLVPAPSPA